METLYQPGNEENNCGENFAAAAAAYVVIQL